MPGRVLSLGLCALAACSGAPELGVDDAAPPASTVAPAPSAAGHAAVARPPARRFVLVEGAVRLDGEPATVGLEIGSRADIVVAPGARAVVTLGPGSFVELRSGARVRLGSSKLRKVSLQLLAGAAWSFVAPEASYEVVTTNVIARAPGGPGTFFVDARRGQTYVCDCDGDLQLQVGGARALPRNVASLDEHVDALIRGRGARAKMLEAARRGHTDAEAGALREVLAEVGE